MSVPSWKPCSELTPVEELLMGRLKRPRKLFGFLRRHRLGLFDDAFQRELALSYRGQGGKEALPPAMMAMIVLLQGYVGASDAEAVELTVVDLRWQRVLGRIGEQTPTCLQGALQGFRQRLITANLDRRVLERTVELARSTGEFDAKKLPKSLRVAMDSSPLERAGQVEDTSNLPPHAARNVATCAAALFDRPFEDICHDAGIPLLRSSSVKAGLDRVWPQTGEKAEALNEPKSSSRISTRIPRVGQGSASGRGSQPNVASRSRTRR